MPRHITVPIVLGLGAAATLYALTVQKEEPRTSSTILAIIGATAGILSIGGAVSSKLSASKALQVTRSVGNSVNSVMNMVK